ncbi:MAG TPA: NAD(P)-dependent oxidoreductase [Xanthobacteraceae bacterium]|jgi:3-hydroxyisobutyrate dehydrogenase-like beta-hydroxyacid dehydrogenase
MSMRVACIGLGRMGGPMSRNLAKAGHDLIVFDVRSDAVQSAVAQGAAAAGSARDAAAGADAVLVSVPGPQEDDAALLGRDGVLAGARKGLLVIDATTITVDQSRRLARQCREQGVDYLEAPVSGAPHGAVAGTLTVMAGGEQAVFDRALPILRCIGSNIRLIGPSGCGTAIKLINQAIYVSYMSVFAEGLALGEALGIPLDTLLDVLGSSAAGHPMIATKYDEIRGRAKTGFALERAMLFMDLARESFEDVHLQTPVIDAAAASVRRGLDRGLHAKDIIVARNEVLARAAAE